MLAASAVSRSLSLGTTAWNIGGTLLQPLFHGGELRAKRRQAFDDLDQATAQYRGTVLSALEDVADTLQALQDAKPPDQPKIDELGNQLVWETRIFEDRRRVVKFVCEVPTTLDQRLFALGRTIQQEIE